MQMKHRTGEGWETLYPKTIAENVKMNNGKTVEQWKQDVDDSFNSVEQKIGVEESPLWEGLEVMGENDSINISKNLTDCKIGWIFAWRKMSSNSQYQYSFVHKSHIAKAAGRRGLKIVVSDSGGVILVKYLLIDDDKITGHESNVVDGNQSIGLFGVYEL